MENEKHYIYNKATKKFVSSHPNKKEAYKVLIDKHHFDKDLTVLHPSEFHIYNAKLNEENMRFKDFLLAEKELTPAEKKKREEIVTAMKKENPDMDKSKAYAIATATAKRVAEDVEELDELNKDTLKNYVKKASKDIVGQQVNRAEYRDNAIQAKKSGNKGSEELFVNAYKEKTRKSNNRVAGIAKAVDKLTKESEELDESPSFDNWSAHQALSGGTIRKSGHYLKRGEKYVDNVAHPSADHALKAWKALDDRKGVKIVKESEELEEAYKVIVHHKHPDGKKQDYTYIIKNATSEKHARNTATKIHRDKVKGEYESNVYPDVEKIDESIEHEYIQSELAHKDINSKVEDGKIVVHKDNVAKAKAHVKKMGYSHPVVSGLNEEEIAEESVESATKEELDEMTVMTAKQLHKHLTGQGWSLDRTSGGHFVYKHPKSNRNIAVPNHRGDLSSPTVSQIIKKSKINESEKKSFKDFITK